MFHPTLSSRILHPDLLTYQHMSETDELEQQISNLSVQLLQAIEHSDSLEQRLSAARKQLATESAAREAAQQEALRLGAEMEDLSASLFTKASEMVKEARISEAKVLERNAHLLQIIKERDTLMENMTLQLSQLKDVLRTTQDQAQVNPSGLTHTPTSSNTTTSSSLTLVPKSQFMVLRTDLDIFNEFCEMIPNTIDINSDNIISYPNMPLKEYKFMKRLIPTEVEPTLKLDTAPGLSWLAKRSLMSAIMEARVILEPLAPVNDLWLQHLQTAFSENPSSPNIQPTHLDAPKATIHPCTFCAETRSDILHLRLYILKLYPKTSSSSISLSNSTTPISDSRSNSPLPSPQQHIQRASLSSITTDPITYPLCPYCLYRIRSVCHFISFLSSIQNRIWKCDKRNKIDLDKCWRECIKRREGMFWGRVGVWCSNEMEKEIYDQEKLSMNININDKIKEHENNDNDVSFNDLTIKDQKDFAQK